MNDNEYLCALVERVAREGMVALELGVQRGTSSFAMAKVIKKHHGFLFAVDKWPDEDMFVQFLHDSALYWGTIIPYRTDLFSLDQLWQDGAFDLIHFDACYTWPDVRLMIKRYLPKIRAGGIACGHGADCSWSGFPKEYRKWLELFPDKVTMKVKLEIAVLAMRQAIKQDIGAVELHTNLARALDEIFNDDYELNRENTFWSKVV